MNPHPIERNSVALNWAQEEIYHSGDQFFAALLAAIEKAHRSIELETYIFEKDSLGERVIKALVKAAEKGLRVRLMIDGFGSAWWNIQDIEELRSKKVYVNVYHSLPWHRTRFWFFSLFYLRHFIQRWQLLNRRNHRKVCIIDGRIAFVGSMNISAIHMEEFMQGKSWRDSCVRVEGVGVRYLRRSFEFVWRNTKRYRFWQKWGKGPRLPNYPLVRLNDSRMRRRQEYADLLARIDGAKKKVWITNPYFVPDLSLLRALRFAAWRGVDVRILLPGKNNHWFMQWVAESFYPILQRAGVRIFEFAPSPLHAKIVLIDHWAILGSSNFNHRSLIHDLEVDIVLTHPQSILNIQRQFLLDLQQAQEIFLSNVAKKFFAKKWVEWIFLRFRYWI